MRGLALALGMLVLSLTGPGPAAGEEMFGLGTPDGRTFERGEPPESWPGTWLGGSLVEPWSEQLEAELVAWSESTGSLPQVGEASFYQTGRKTASGERFDPEGMTAAMFSTRLLGTWVRVTRLDTGASVQVKVNDRGPFAVDDEGRALRPLRPHPTRVIDLARGAFRRLASLGAGVIRVRVERD